MDIECACGEDCCGEMTWDVSDLPEGLWVQTSMGEDWAEIFIDLEGAKLLIQRLQECFPELVENAERN